MALVNNATVQLWQNQDHAGLVGWAVEDAYVEEMRGNTVIVFRLIWMAADTKRGKAMFMSEYPDTIE